MSKQKKQTVIAGDDFVCPDYDAIDLAREELDALAQEGTVEAIKKIEDYVAREQDWDIKTWAELALSKAKRCYYSPRNVREEKDFLLVKMIDQKENKNSIVSAKIAATKLELRRLALDKSVYDELKKGKNKKAIEESEFGFSEDYKVTVQSRLSALEDELSFNLAWIDAARKMIVNKKFTDIPQDVLRGIELDGEKGNFWIDNVFCPSSEYNDSEIKIEDIPF